MTKDKAMAIVLDAADMWLQELHMYVIPEHVGDPDSTHEESALDIEEALGVLSRYRDNQGATCRK